MFATTPSMEAASQGSGQFAQAGGAGEVVPRQEQGKKQRRRLHNLLTGGFNNGLM